MGNKILNKLLDENKVERDFRKEVKDGYRDPLEDVLKDIFDETPIFRYGGSLAKGTANKYSADIDLLCYLPSSSDFTVSKIYEQVRRKLIDEGYIFNAKNSAFEVSGKMGEKTWDTRVDIVPGKFINNNEGDVNLWKSKTKERFKTNPKKQIDKVRKSNSRDVIRLLKLYRNNAGFDFKSFYLELFVVDIAEADFDDGDNLIDKVIKTLKHKTKIGVKSVEDPANSNNDILDLHTEYEYNNIKEKLFKLYDVLMTNNPEAIEAIFLNENYDIEEAYRNNVRKTSVNINFDESSYYDIEPSKFGEYNQKYKIYTYKPGGNIEFKINEKHYPRIKKLRWGVANSGYEACKKKMLRGDIYEDSSNSQSVKIPRIVNQLKQYTKTESTDYFGNHFVQAEITLTDDSVIYSKVFTVKIRI